MTRKMEKEKALKLRKAGHSYNYIAGRTAISKSTLHCWLANIPYTPNKETIKRIGRALAKSGEVKSRLKLESFKRAGDEAKNEIGQISQRDLFMLGLGLYMGEGTKTHDMVRIINADAKMICLAIRWFREVCGLPKENFSIRLHLYPDNNEQECIKFWSGQTKIPTEQFQKTQIDRRKNKKLFKHGKLPYGTAHMTVRSCGNKKFGVFLSRKINAWISEVCK